MTHDTVHIISVKRRNLMCVLEGLVPMIMNMYSNTGCNQFGVKQLSWSSFHNFK